MADTTVCGPFAQTLFLGASIISFSASLGWNGDQGSLTVELAEDSCRGTKIYYESAGIPRVTSQPDFFNPPKVGSPVYFKFGSFTFGGILQNWEQQVDPKGGKTYTVKVVDGLEILENTQVIINNYTGQTFGVPNLINAFGYTEELALNCNTLAYTNTLNPPLKYVPAVGFGGANIAEDGMSWFQIKNAISDLTVIPTKFGGQLQLRDQRYYVDLSELPTLDANFRFTGDSLTILEAISQVCSASGRDFFTEILYFTPNTIPAGYGGITGLLHPDILKFIKVRTVSRTVQKTSAYNVDFTVGSPIELRLNLGKLTQFVGNGSGRARSARGLELRSDITNSFVVGDNRQDLWQQAYSGSADTYTDTIWPYWGKNSSGFPIISNGINNNHNFTISTEGFGPDLINILGPTYNLTLVELRTALTGMEEWSVYLWSEKQAIAESLEIDTSFTMDLVTVLDAASAKPKSDDLKTTDTASMKRAYKHAGGNPDNEQIDKAELQKRLYDIIRSYAELAGKKFLVSIPLVCSATDNAAPFAVKLSWEPSDGAWTDADIQLHPLATTLEQDAGILELLRLDDGRITCFVYFNTQSATKLIDYSQLSPDEVIPISPTECYVRGNVEEITFLNPVARTYPRAVISLNNVISIKGSDSSEVDAKIVDNLVGWLTDVGRDWLDTKASSTGDDTNKLSMSPLPIIPLGAAVPLRSANLSYGPWFTTLSFGPASKTSYERDTSLSPWSFGSTNIMNYAGQIKVESQVTEQVVSESGSLTIPGAPPGRLGDVLLAGGPEITNIDVEVSTGGVTSSLRLRTFVPNFGEIGRRRIQNLRTAGTYQQKLQRAFLNRAANRITQNAFANFTRPFVKSDRFDRHSSHSIICGEIFNDYQGTNLGFKRTGVSITDTRKALPEMYRDYDKKALMDLNGLFMPFETSGVVGHGLPAFSGKIPTATNITCLSLNPFKIREQYNGSSSGHNIEYIARGTGITAIGDLSIKKDGTYGTDLFRPLGLKAPLVLVGWGFDLNGKPVPNKTPGSPGTEFADNYLRRPDIWKAGPLDARWDEERGVWSAVSANMRIARLVENLIPGAAAYGQLGSITIVSGNPQIYPNGGNNTVTYVFETGLTLVFDGLKNTSLAVSNVKNFPQYPATPSGAVIYVQKEQTSNQWFMTAASVW